MSCGTALEARRNSDERWTFTPSSRNYTFSGMAPLFTVRRGETVLLQIDQTQTVNGSLFSVVGDSVVLQLKKGDAALLDGPTPDTDAEALFYDVTLTDQTGFENWIVGGPFTLLGLNDVSCGGCNEKVEVTLGGQCIQINIEGGNLGVGASVNLNALNKAVQDAEAAATEAEIAAQEAEQAANQAATAGAAAGAAAGSASGATAGTAAGAIAGADAGETAAQAVVSMKLDKLSELASLPAATTGVPYRVGYRTVPGDGYAGEFEWIAGNQSANVAADPGQGVWVAPASTPTGASGAFKRSFNGGVYLDWWGAGNGNVAQDQAAWNAATAFLRGTGYKLLLLDAKIYYQTDTIILPKGVTLRGSGKYDRWGLSNTGTILMTSGAGTARRWTDITGSDPTDDTPQIVAGGNAVQVEDITLITGSPNAWSAGYFIPGVRQCGFRNLQAFGHTDGCMYLDATWSSINTTLTALHPLVQSDNGPLEFTGTGCYMRGGGTAGWAVKVQGTTRAHTATPWVWSPGGASDLKIAFGRLGSDASGAGGAISIDGQMPTTAATYIQGFTFDSCDLRVASAQYQVKFDRANRVILTNCYGEVSGGGAGEFAVTSRTQASLDGIIIFGDKLNSGSITVDGTPVSGSGAELYSWEKTRCVTRYRSDGRIFTPGITSSQSNLALKLKSFATAGQFLFAYDDGTSVNDYAALSNTQFRPIVSGALNLGSSNFNWNQAHVREYRAAPMPTVVIASGAITYPGTYVLLDTEGSAATDDLDTINGGGDGAIAVIGQVANSRDVTLKDGTGNLRLAGDCVLTTANDTITLMRRNSLWCEMSRSING